MTCHPSSLNYAQLIKSRAIVLIDLSGSSIEAEAGSLATLFMAGFFRASKILGEIPEGAPPRYYVYIDEIERVATHAFKELLAQVRKLGLSLVLAHQHFSQLSTEVKEAIVGNVGTYTIFEIGSDDARELAPYFEPEVKKDELVKLGKYRAAVKTRYHEKTLPGFIVNTLPPVPRAEIHLLPGSGVIDTEWIRSHSHKTQQMILETLVRAVLEKRYRGNEPDVDDTQPARRQSTKATKPTPPAKPRRTPAVKDFE
jgi:hypothetical protein